MQEANFICGGNKFAYSKGYIGLPIQVNKLPESVEIEGERLVIKSSFHVSLVCVKDIVDKYGGDEKRILELFCSFIKDNEIEFLEYTGEFRFAENVDRKTLVALCKISNLEELFIFLRRELVLDIPLQPTHVTLFTLQPDLGIGLNSQADMEGKSVTVTVPDEVRAVIK